MEGLPSLTGPSRAPGSTVDPTHVKTPADYLRSLRRRVWLVLAVAVPLSMLTAVFVAKQPNVYRASAEITIDPPQYDPALSSLVSHEIGGRDAEYNTRYVANKNAMLKSKVLAEEVVNDPSLAQSTAPGEEAVLELVNNLQSRQVPNSNRFQVLLEGTDPARTTRMLYTLLEIFKNKAKEENDRKNDASKLGAESSRNALKSELDKLDQKIYSILSNSNTIGPGGEEPRRGTLSEARQRDAAQAVAPGRIPAAGLDRADVSEHAGYREPGGPGTARRAREPARAVDGPHGRDQATGTQFQL